MTDTTTIPRPIPACALRAQIPTHHLRAIVDWAQSIAEFQEGIGNLPVAGHASWMCAVLNPDWEDGECPGLTTEEASRSRIMWAACGSEKAHEAHRQGEVSTLASSPQERQVRAVLNVMGWPDDRREAPGGEVRPGVHWDLGAEIAAAVLGADSLDPETVIQAVRAEMAGNE